MKIAIVHSFYRSSLPSGENSSVRSQLEILRSRGHDVQLFSQDTDIERRRPFYELRSGLSTVTGIGPSPLKAIREFQPHVIHVHNLFPNFGTRWLDQIDSPLVATIHNFRAVCANGLLFRDGHNCTECITNGSIRALKHSCYHDSRLATLPLALRNSRGINFNPLLHNSNALVTLSRQAKVQLTHFGYPKDLLHVIPNGIPDSPLSLGVQNRQGWIAIGRLSQEKGFAELAEIWPESESLDIVGDGPERSRIEQVKGPSIQVLGALSSQEILERLPNYRGLILPSICFEMQPTVVSEALSRGVPIIARVGNSGSDLVERFKVGAIYEDAGSLHSGLQEVAHNQNELGRMSRKLFQDEFSTESWVTRIEVLYNKLI